MRVISKKPLRKFWEARKADANIAKLRLTEWYKLATAERWKNFAELKQTFPTADQVGNCTVFDVGGNRYRLIGRVNFRSGRLYVLAVMDHAEYDDNRWPRNCGCHLPPP